MKFIFYTQVNANITYARMHICMLSPKRHVNLFETPFIVQKKRKTTKKDKC